MAIYVVGDLQGCLKPLKKLLKKVDFDPKHDQLWSAGDVVNRGPKSLKTLRYLYKMGDAFRMVLGNHDLHLLAVASGAATLRPKDTLQEILDAPDREQLIHWLQQQPLLIHDQGYCLVHAGIPPRWSIKKAKRLAAEVEAVLRGPNPKSYFDAMYGNTPDKWSKHLQGTDRLRVITNYLTRMRFCTAKGKLELTQKLGPKQAPKGYAPWFFHEDRKAAHDKILFGHWAALEGQDCGTNLYPLDTGCVWGGKLRMMRLEDEALFEVTCESCS
ncbi:symmetrical bis(5'-nucleosyl)-tetraphosphatase [Porticoccus sp. W117]|uniref:symmetrical bis(5'-nucleosyl)-tetraphosphatase n=1 Tax=Porticoccus sp. W117 TaxID=3054777 RepID=UPI002597C53E|nr:symmetrical bis(5'-nucleosyl)-tetraphosphatase [Porticoccus sp. W117]MDM3870668.1 symmetrical bis(5'-nucleosyl)-tetraphosphatase [Porticoccus sp. W117]